MEQNIPKLHGERHAGISSKVAKLPTDARLAVQMRLVSSAADAMTLQIILDIWFTLPYPLGTAAAVIVVILKRGVSRYIARYIASTNIDRKAKANLRSKMDYHKISSTASI